MPAPPRPYAVADIECYIDYFLISFREIGGQERRKHFEFYEGHPLDRQGLIKVLRNFTLVTFNGNNYDIPVLRYALKLGVTNADLKRLGDAIIVRGLKPWHAEKEFRLPDVPFLDSIDIIEPAPSVNVSLKLYGGRLHSRRLQDLPLDPSARVLELPGVRETMVEYCYNDCETTEDLYRHIEKQIELRCQMSEQYGVDLRSKSDAQIAEAIIKSEMEKILGDKIVRPELPHDYSFQYNPPSFLRFQTKQMRDVFKVVTDATFKLKKKEVSGDDDDAVSVGGVKVKVSGVEMPKEIKALKITIGESTYQMGIGGLHSTETKVSHFSDDEYVIRDADVASYYPAIMLNCGLYPDHLGVEFLNLYRTIRERRIAAKRAGDKVTDMTLKIVLNGTFGKLGSKWSALYAPNLMLQVTITGQLALLMLIEELERSGISVISANTDGIVSKVPRDMQDTYHDIIKSWEERTGFEMEFADYAALYSMSVNSYIAVKDGGGVKQKGLFAFTGSKGSPAEKNPTSYVCIDAVINYLTKGTPIMETLEWCPDIRRFLVVRRVTGGAEYKGQYLGKVVRYYHSSQSKEIITYASEKKKGHKVPKSEGAMPLMELDGTLPSDIDYQRYYNEAVSMLGDLGVL